MEKKRAILISLTVAVLAMVPEAHASMATATIEFGQLTYSGGTLISGQTNIGSVSATVAAAPGEHVKATDRITSTLEFAASSGDLTLWLPYSITTAVFAQYSQDEAYSKNMVELAASCETGESDLRRFVQTSFYSDGKLLSGGDVAGVLMVDLPYGRWAREPLTVGRLFHRS